ncbi:hyaluronidase PH-20-like [Alosa sapidissima]|uniref:hyaluronidase PH-20-like n=1 Tax=Alosa sapidissima TaxID=34773 RepID=UPI001C092AF9|nr:hyaluronidase PH-20-like [Alosa sapidissima]
MEHYWAGRGISSALFPVILSLLAACCPATSLPQTAAPIVDGKPFMVIWNGPLKHCTQQEVPLDMTAFQAVTTPALVADQFLSLFYSNHMGIYPYTDYKTGTEFNGGIPQKANLGASLAKSRAEVSEYIPELSPGLGVIDWEAWRPIFERNWGSKMIYQKLSVAYAQQQDPSLTSEQAELEAREQFQSAARNFMEGTLKVAVSDRPEYLWGFYLFPNCYNYGTDEPGYTGKCPEVAQQRNNELLWLWEASTALFPSAYLSTSLKGNYNAALFVRNVVQEAMRVSALPEGPYTAPVYLYSRPLFRDQNKIYLTEIDLVRSIGESAALGAAGTVMWGASSDYDSQASCDNLSDYLLSTLNPYIANVTAATQICSNFLCQGNGRCVRRNYNTDTYLHLNPQHFHIQRSVGSYVVTGVPSTQDFTDMYNHFTCQCYAGRSCSAAIPTQPPQSPLVIHI